ncbi:unnamed protein product [Linum tenue]|uniref:Uncharacterized protein n=1 Tax=Linum tenue TaxID=586396 RepID=A0AAV0IBX2_9ROSI|nr:unnamed protein product [Linum tenue]
MASGSAAADGFFRNWVFEGSLSGADYGIERRPYHRNCKCALHENPATAAETEVAGTARTPSRIRSAAPGARVLLPWRRRRRPVLDPDRPLRVRPIRLLTPPGTAFLRRRRCRPSRGV